jgi:hypothetical protein
MARASTSTRRLAQVASGLAATFLAVFAVGASAGQIYAKSAPELVLRLWPRADEARAQYAARKIADIDVPIATRQVADAMASDVIAHDPTNVTALRTRGLAAALAGHQTTALRWMRYSEVLSRRDLPTQLWWIEEAINQNDIDTALLHYDRALRTSNGAVDLLFPVLIAASAEPEVADKLSRLLASRPNWWGPFMNRLIGEAPAPVVLDRFARRLRLSPNDPLHPDFFPRILQRLVAADDFRRADALYRIAVPQRQATLQNGNFELADGIAPFAWTLTDDGELNATIEPRPDGAAGFALILNARNGRTGVVATQALSLAAGRYLLRGVAAQTGLEDATRPTVKIRCGSIHPIDIASLRLPVASEQPRPFQSELTIPASCPGVWLSIEATSDLNGSDRRPWVDELMFDRIPG